MALDLWLTFVAASTALLLIPPGPTVLLVLSYALSQGRRVAVASATGVALGDLVAMSASLAGLGALVLTSAMLFTALKWIGAAYLVWMGLKLLRTAPNQGLSLPDAPAQSTPGRSSGTPPPSPRSTRNPLRSSSLSCRNSSALIRRLCRNSPF